MRLRHKDLQAGRVLNINGGSAKLLRRKPSRFIQDGLPYILKEKPNESQDDTLHVYAKERWEVEWVEHPYYRKGDITCVHIDYFIKVTTDHPSYYDYNAGTTSRAEIQGLYVFIDEEILTVDGDSYTPETVKALKKVLKAFNGALIIYSASPMQVRERFELSKISRRIFDFIHTDVTFEQGIEDYLENTDYDDYLVLAARKTNLPRTLVYKDGLKLKNDQKRDRRKTEPDY